MATGRGDLRASVAARGAAINARLIAVLATVSAFRFLALAGPANEALAILPRLALGTVRAEGAIVTPAINARLVVVLDFIRARRRRACPPGADSLHAINVYLAGASRKARAARTTAIWGRLSATLVPLIVHTMHLDANHTVARETTGAEGHIIYASDARAVIANSFAGLGAYVGIPIWLCHRLPHVANIERALQPVIVCIARLFNFD